MLWDYDFIKDSRDLLSTGNTTSQMRDRYHYSLDVKPSPLGPQLVVFGETEKPLKSST